MSDLEERRQRNRALIERVLGAVGHGGIEHFTDDAVLELPYADPPVRLEGKDAIQSRLGPALDLFKFRLQITAIYDCTDPDMLVLEYTSDGHVTTTGKAYRNAYVGIVRFRDGAICFQREYYNPLPAQRALSPD